jgi:NTE family protein
MDAMQKRKTINLALQGGGSHAAFVWGILDALLEDGRIEFDSVTATSGGAMNAVVLAHGLRVGGKEGARIALHDFWQSIAKSGELYSPSKLMPWESFLQVSHMQSTSYIIFDYMTKLYSPYQFNPFNINPLKEVLAEHIDFDALKTSSPIKVFLSASNVRTGKVKIFEKEEISIDATLASACLPFLFQAVEIDGEAYWDGGYMGNPALFPVIYQSSHPDILILHVNPIYRENIPETAADILSRVNEISFNSSLLRELRAMKFITQMLDNGWIKEEYQPQLKRLYLHAIRAEEVMTPYTVASKLNVEWHFLMELFEKGRIQGLQWLKNNYASLGKKSTVSFDDYT